MVRLLYGVSPLGLGHATRAVAVAERLKAQGLEVRFASGGPAVECLRGYGFEVDDVITEPIPDVRGGEMKNAAVWYLRYWRVFKRSKLRVQELLDNWRPDLLVGDEEFSTMTLALERGLPHALMTDELELGFARTWLGRKVEGRVSEWYGHLLHSVSLLMIPDEGVDTGNRRYVGPIVRSRTKTRTEIVEEFSLPREGRIIVLALSGTGIGSHMIGRSVEAMLSVPGSILVVIGNRGKKVGADRVFDLGVVRDGQNFVAAADLVVSTAGKSTIDEAASFGTPIIAIPIRNHAEQERNAAALGYGPSDLGRLPELVRLKAGKREAPRNYSGAEAASRLILSIL
jgi:UDP-N-acetylglucosamine--N-acetylmuramyl-(pentapeptide) pyrophosphoryl-undecaprenol N-acetylglucosamine transferase